MGKGIKKKWKDEIIGRGIKDKADERNKKNGKRENRERKRGVECWMRRGTK